MCKCARLLTCVSLCVWLMREGHFVQWLFNHIIDTHPGPGMSPLHPFNSHQNVSITFKRRIIHAFYNTNRKLHFYWVNKHTEQTHSVSCARSFNLSIHFFTSTCTAFVIAEIFFFVVFFSTEIINNPQQTTSTHLFYGKYFAFRCHWNVGEKSCCCFHFICLFIEFFAILYLSNAWQ